MARGINKTTLLGNLGSDPEVRYMPNGGAVTNFSLATSSSFKDKEGNWQTVPEWHKVVVFGSLGESCAKNLKKGDRAYIEGSNKTSSWDKDGQKHWKTEVIAKEIIFLSYESNQAAGNDVPDIEDVPF